jgi:hypothetical protein
LLCAHRDLRCCIGITAVSFLDRGHLGGCGSSTTGGRFIQEHSPSSSPQWNVVRIRPSSELVRQQRVVPERREWAALSGTHLLLMLAMHGLNLSQRIIAIVGFGVLLWFVGSFVSSLGEPGVFGWVAYAPLSGASSVHAPGTYLTSLEDFFLWLAIVVVWVAGAMFLLRTPQKKDEPEV